MCGHCGLWIVKISKLCVWHLASIRAKVPRPTLPGVTPVLAPVAYFWGNVGYVDFLTLQVFFWVLMVAVQDESLEAQKLHNLAQKACEESTDAVSGSQATSAVDCAKLAAAQVAPNGSKICELLMRFNPKQLRQEFKQLYLDRLHHGKWTEGAEAEASTSSVSLSSKSRRLAERAHLRIQEESGSRRHVDMLLWRQGQVEAHRQRLREERDAQQVEQCTFRPCLVSRHNRSMNGKLVALLQGSDHIFSSRKFTVCGAAVKELN
eukprot:s559_g6.t1